MRELHCTVHKEGVSGSSSGNYTVQYIKEEFPGALIGFKSLLWKKILVGIMPATPGINDKTLASHCKLFFLFVTGLCLRVKLQRTLGHKYKVGSTSKSHCTK